MAAICPGGAELAVGMCYWRPLLPRSKHSWGKWSFVPVIDFKLFFREPSNNVDNTNW